MRSLTPLSHGVKLDGLPEAAHVPVLLSSFCIKMLTDPFRIGYKTPWINTASWERLQGNPEYEAAEKLPKIGRPTSFNPRNPPQLGCH